MNKIGILALLLIFAYSAHASNSDEENKSKKEENFVEIYFGQESTYLNLFSEDEFDNCEKTFADALAKLKRHHLVEDDVEETWGTHEGVLEPRIGKTLSLRISPNSYQRVTDAYIVKKNLDLEEIINSRSGYTKQTREEAKDEHTSLADIDNLSKIKEEIMTEMKNGEFKIVIEENLGLFLK